MSKEGYSIQTQEVEVVVSHSGNAGKILATGYRLNVHLEEWTFAVTLPSNQLWFGELKDVIIEASKQYTPCLQDIKKMYIEIIREFSVGVNSSEAVQRDQTASTSKKDKPISSLLYSDEYDDIRHLKLTNEAHITIRILTSEEYDRRIEELKADEDADRQCRRLGRCLCFPCVACGICSEGACYCFECLDGWIDFCDLF